MFKIELGTKVKDSVTGFMGVAIARCEYLNGCLCYEVQPVMTEKGKMPKAIWIDEQQLTEVKEKKRPEKQGKGTPGVDFRMKGGPADRPTKTTPIDTYENEDDNGQGYHNKSNSGRE